MLGPLTAQALVSRLPRDAARGRQPRRAELTPLQGRSPYDEVVEGEGEEDQSQPTQQYDYRGRPINPDTRRINRDIVRSHNEVMLVIGVAETENSFSTTEGESQRRYGEYEEDVGHALIEPALQCVESSGVFGLDGLRQRILVCAPARDGFELVLAAPGTDALQDLQALFPDPLLAASPRSQKGFLSPATSSCGGANQYRLRIN